MISFLFDSLNYAFWWIAFNTFQTTVRFVMIFVPTKLVQSRVTSIFGKLGIKVTVEGGDETPGKYDKKAYKCEMVIHNIKFFKRLACNDMIGLGESYMVRKCSRVAWHAVRKI